MIVLYITLIILGAFLLWQVFIRLVRRFWHFPAPAIIGRILDSRWRLRVLPPAQVIERSGIKPGMTIVELGCGSGAIIIFAAQAVGETGKVYAVDIQPAMLKQLEQKLSRPENQNIKNIELKQASAYEMPFGDNSIDLLYMAAVLEEIPDKSRALQEVNRVLKPQGILAVTEFLPLSAAFDNHQDMHEGGFHPRQQIRQPLELHRAL
jgi:SAM-dependent methyltransferase